jgi:amino acid transporter
MTLFMLSLLGIFIVCGLFTNQIAGSLDLNAPQGFLGVLRASAFIFVVYLGGEAIAVAQGEIKNPGKTIPRAILLTCVTLIVIYSATVFVVLRVVPPESLIGKASPLAYVAEQFMGPLGVVIVTVAGIVAAVSSVNTSTMAHSRVAYALARDGYFPKGFFSVHKRFCTPFIAVLLGSAFTAMFAATGIVNFVAYATDFGFIIGFIFVNLSLIRLRKIQPNLHRPFKVPLYPLTPILGIATSLMLIFFLEPGTLLIGLELFVFGLVAYYIRMVGYYRISLAVGGMNFGISVFSALIACLIASGAVPIWMSESVRWLATSGTALVSVICLVAGLLNVTRREE